jgi:DNA-binding GntR family transcriptional regulator
MLKSMANNREDGRSNYKLERSGLPEAIAVSLQERILSGEFKEGDQLIQDAIAREYEVSRMPVREALRQLEAAGLVKLRLHKGAVVTSIPIEQIAELFQLRSRLESDLLATAMPRMQDSDIDAANETLLQLETAYEEGAIREWGPLNWEFHRRLYEPSNRVQTLLIVQSINVQVERYIRMQLTLTKSFAVAKAEHRKLLRFCASRDSDRAVEFLVKHIDESGKKLLRVIAESRRVPGRGDTAHVARATS